MKKINMTAANIFLNFKNKERSGIKNKIEVNINRFIKHQIEEPNTYKTPLQS
jgi:hypothetical protein